MNAEYLIPSAVNSVLSEFSGKVITNIFRCGYFNLENLNELAKKHGSSSVFRSYVGAVCIELESTEFIAVFEMEKNHSVRMKFPTKTWFEERFSNQPKSKFQFMVLSMDGPYGDTSLSEYLGKEISAIKIIKQKSNLPKKVGLAGEVGLLIEFSDAYEELYIGVNLAPGGGGRSVMLLRKGEVDFEWLQKGGEFSILNL